MELAMRLNPEVLTRYCYYLLYHSWQQIGDWRHSSLPPALRSSASPPAASSPIPRLTGLPARRRSL